MKIFFDSFIWAFLIVFLVPTLLIVASWNSIPGEVLFPVKLGLEQSLAFVVSPSYAASGQLQIKYTERRFADAQRGLAQQHSVEGLVYLEKQIATTKKTISRVGDTKTKTELTDSYIQTLEDVSAALETQKQTVVRAAPLVPAATPTPIPTPTSTATPTPTPVMGNKPVEITQQPAVPAFTPTPTPAPTLIPTPTLIQTARGEVSTTASISTKNAIVAIQIDATQKSIKETIKELKEEKVKDEKESRDDSKKRKKTERSEMENENERAKDNSR